MNDNENRRYQMFLRVARFGSAHGADFAANSIGKQLFTNLSTIISELDGHGALEFSGVKCGLRWIHFTEGLPGRLGREFHDAAHG